MAQAIRRGFWLSGRGLVNIRARLDNPVHVFEISFPGTFLDHADRDWIARIQTFLRLLEDQFTDAVVALNLFETEQARLLDELHARGQKETDKEEEPFRHTLEQNILEEVGEEKFFRMYPVILHFIELEMRRQSRESGQMPHEYQRRLLWIYAHAYVYALDSFHKVLENLTKERDRPNTIEKELTKFRAAFPHLKGIRDSAHHLEDRGLGRDRRGNPLKLEPIDNGIVRAPGGGVLLLSVLEGNRLWYTLEDGSHGELAISHDNIAIAAEVFQSVINAFRWKGRPRLIPS